MNSNTYITRLYPVIEFFEDVEYNLFDWTSARIGVAVNDPQIESPAALLTLGILVSLPLDEEKVSYWCTTRDDTCNSPVATLLRASCRGLRTPLASGGG